MTFLVDGDKTIISRNCYYGLEKPGCKPKKDSKGRDFEACYCKGNLCKFLPGLVSIDQLPTAINDNFFLKKKSTIDVDLANLVEEIKNLILSSLISDELI